MRIIATPIIPKKGQTFENAAKAALRYAQTKVEPRMVKWSEKVVEGWSDPHTFEASSKVEGGDLVIYCKPVGAIAQKWEWVSFGTKPRQIPAAGKPGKFMAFPSTFTPRTKPAGARVVSGGPGTKTGPMVYTHRVGTKKLHQIKPRNFEKVFYYWSRFWFAKGVQDAINEAFK